MHGGGPGFEPPRLHPGPAPRCRGHLDNQPRGAAEAPRPRRRPAPEGAARPRAHRTTLFSRNEGTRDPRTRARRAPAWSGGGGAGPAAASRRRAPGEGLRARPRGPGGGWPRGRAHGGCLGVGGRRRTRPRGETPRGGAGSLGSGGVRMGQPARRTAGHRARRGAGGTGGTETSQYPEEKRGFPQ